MNSWETLEPDWYLLVPSSNYTSGRGGKSVDRVVVHHNAGNLSHKQVYNAFISNGTSAHYNVGIDGSIVQFVYDSNTAWHAGNYDVNQRSIGVEHCNDDTGAWTVSAETLENGAHLVAAICCKFGLGRPVWGTNVVPHNWYRSTSCPGQLDGSQNAEYMARAQYWYDVMTGAVAEEATPVEVVKVECAIQCEPNLTDSQLWKLEEDTDGYYTVSCKRGGVLDMIGGTDAGPAANYRYVWTHQANGTPAQRWKKLDGVAEGSFMLANSIDEAYVIDAVRGPIGTRGYVQMHTKQEEAVNQWAQSWYAVPYWNDPEWVCLVNAKSLYLLDANPQALDV